MIRYIFLCLQFERHQLKKILNSSFFFKTFSLGIMLMLCLIFITFITDQEADAEQITDADQITLPTNSSLLSYENRILGIKIEYPSSWYPVQGYGRVTFFAPPEDNSNIVSEYLDIIVTSSRNMRLNELVSGEINYYRQNFPDFALIDINQDTLDKDPAYKVLYRYRDGQNDVTRMEFIAIQGEFAYYAIFHSQTQKYPVYLSTIQGMIDSLEIDPSQNMKSNILQGIRSADEFGQYGFGVAGMKVAGVPTAVAVNPNTNMAYVSNSRSNTVSIINTVNDRVVDNVTVGNSPYGLAVNHFENTIYVANFRSNTVSVVDGSTNTVVDTIKVDTNPLEVVVNPDTNMIYVANYGSNTVSVIDGFTNRILANVTLDRIPSGDLAGMGLAIDLYRNLIYVAKSNSDSVSVIDGTTNDVIANVTVGNHPASLAVNPDTNLVYVANARSNTVSVINGTSNGVVRTINVGANPDSVVLNPNTNMIYAANLDSDSVSVINGSTNDVLANVTVGKGPQGLAVNPDTNTIYVANFRSNTVSTVNGTSNDLMVGINFKTNPSSSGGVYCNESKIIGMYIKYNVGTQLKCQAKANSILGVFSPMTFDHWSGNLAPNPDNDPTVTFIVSHFGTLAANFREIIPSEFLTKNILIPVILGTVIPAVIAWMFAKRRRSYLHRYMKIIQEAYEKGSYKNKEERLRRLGQIREEITEQFNKGSINESHYGILDGKISDYQDQISKQK
jgi:YVTN family beta-propeller protein